MTGVSSEVPREEHDIEAKQDETTASRVVVVGASAGGVEALSRLVAGLPAHFPAGVLVVLHVTPSGTSVLPAILARAGVLPAAHAVDGETIEAGRIYVAPPDRHLVVEDGHVRLTRGPHENGHRPAVDPLFRTAAAALGTRVIAVVLSGSRDDGTAGMIEVRRVGGIGVVQSPDEALYPSMPLSAIEHAHPEHVLGCSAIGGLLAQLAEPQTNGGGDPPARGESDGGGEGGEVQPSSGVGDVPPGVVSAFSCPECGGALWELQKGGHLHYRCRTGHAYSAQSLVAEQGRAVESALWGGLRALEERVALMRRIAHRLGGRGLKADDLERRAQAAESHALVLRDLLEGEAAGAGDPFGGPEAQAATS